jgi:FixJ family two-component response regulator
VSSEGAPPTVFIVDDDASVLKAVSRLLRAKGFAVETFESAEALLSHWTPQMPGCLLLDIALPGLDGLGLQQRLGEVSEGLAIVFLSGQGDIPMSVRAVKAGAVDFLTKPVKAEALLSAVNSALGHDAKTRRIHEERAKLKQRLETLTTREREVLQALAAGKLNKQVAFDLGIAEKTVKFHRARIMHRLKVGSFAELVLVASELGLGPRR